MSETHAFESAWKSQFLVNHGKPIQLAGQSSSCKMYFLLVQRHFHPTMLHPSLPSGEVGSSCNTPRGQMHLEMFGGLTSLFFSPSLKIPRLMKLSPWFYLYFLKRFLSWRENLEGHHDCGRRITRVKCITGLWGRPAHQAQWKQREHVFDAIRQVLSALRCVWHVQLMENRWSSVVTCMCCCAALDFYDFPVSFVSL